MSLWNALKDYLSNAYGLKERPNRGVFLLTLYFVLMTLFLIGLWAWAYPSFHAGNHAQLFDASLYITLFAAELPISVFVGLFLLGREEKNQALVNNLNAAALSMNAAAVSMNRLAAAIEAQNARALIDTPTKSS